MRQEKCGGVKTVVCVTGQHRGMPDQVLNRIKAVLACFYLQIPIGHVELDWAKDSRLIPTLNGIDRWNKDSRGKRSAV